MQHYVGLDVSVKETSVCIVDKTGKVIREVKVATEPVAILAVLTEEPLAIERRRAHSGQIEISRSAYLRASNIAGAADTSRASSGSLLSVSFMLRSVARCTESMASLHLIELR